VYVTQTLSIVDSDRFGACNLIWSGLYKSGQEINQLCNKIMLMIWYIITTSYVLCVGSILAQQYNNNNQ